jgi:hypothetical protein
MRYQRAVFAAGVAVGFIAGSRAGRERYDQIVKYSKNVMHSPPVQRASAAVSAKAADLSRSAAAKATDVTKSAAARAQRAARRARARIVKINVPKVPTPKVSIPRPGRLGGAHPDGTPAVTQPSVNGNAHAPRDYRD